MAALQLSVHTRRQQRPVYIPAEVLYVPLGCSKGLAEPAHKARQEIQVVKDHNSPWMYDLPVHYRVSKAVPVACRQIEFCIYRL